MELIVINKDDLKKMLKSVVEPLVDKINVLEEVRNQSVEIMTVKQLTKHFDVSSTTIEALQRTGRLKPYYVGSKKYFYVKDFMALLQEKA